MAVLDLLLLALAPGIILMFIFFKIDAGDKEPRKLLLLTFVLGAATVIYVAIVESVLMYLTGTEDFSALSLPLIFVANFFFVALIEESAKLFAVFIYAYKSKAFNETTDGITYMVAASLGFATVENIFYVLESGYAIGLLRAAITVPNHALQSGIMGYYVGKGKFDPKNRTRLNWKGFLIASTLHALTNTCAFSGNLALILIGIPAFVIVEIVLLRTLIKKAATEQFDPVI